MFSSELDSDKYYSEKNCYSVQNMWINYSGIVAAFLDWICDTIIKLWIIVIIYQIVWKLLIFRYSFELFIFLLFRRYFVSFCMYILSMIGVLLLRKKKHIIYSSRNFAWSFVCAHTFLYFRSFFFSLTFDTFCLHCFHIYLFISVTPSQLKARELKNETDKQLAK